MICRKLRRFKLKVILRFGRFEIIRKVASIIKVKYLIKKPLIQIKFQSLFLRAQLGIILNPSKVIQSLFEGEVLPKPAESVKCIPRFQGA